jgi:methionyl aminopeptidase
MLIFRWYTRRVGLFKLGLRLIPSRPLHPEDIINVDLTIFLDGYHGDTSATFLLPEADKRGRELVEATQEALEVGIRECGPGKPLKELGRAIQYVASNHTLRDSDK